jgi:hypothetical protein
LPAIPLLLFAAIDLVLALLLLVAGGFSLEFLVVAAIGLALAGVGMWSVFSKAALAQAQAGDAEPRPLPRLLRPRRRRGRPRT